MDKQEQLSSTTVLLHWLVGVSMIALVSIGLYMANTETHWLYPYHKSFGVLIVLLVLPRIIWRLINGWPQPIRVYPSFERFLAKLVHWILIIATLLMPLSGMMMSGAGGHGIAVFGLELLAGNHNADGQAVPYNAWLASTGSTIHEYVGYLLATTILLHITGALKHHFLDNDGTLSRMLGKRI